MIMTGIPHLSMWEEKETMAARRTKQTKDMSKTRRTNRQTGIRADAGL